MLSSVIYTFLVGIPFIFLFLFLYDVLYGEKREKQLRKIHKRFKNEEVIKIDVLNHEPKKFTLFQVKTKNGTEKIKIKPGYKMIKVVKKKQ